MPEAQGTPFGGPENVSARSGETALPPHRGRKHGPPHGRASRRPRGLGRNRFSLQPCRNPRVPPSETRRTSRHAREKPPYSPIAAGSTGPPMDRLAEGRGVWEGTVFPFSRAGIQGYPLRRPGERLGTLGRNRPTVPSRPEVQGPPYGRASRRPRGLGRNRSSLQPCRNPRVPPSEARRTSRHAREKPPYSPIAAGCTGPPMDRLAEGRGVWEGTVFPFSRAGSTGSPPWTG